MPVQVDTPSKWEIDQTALRIVLLPVDLHRRNFRMNLEHRIRFSVTNNEGATGPRSPDNVTWLLPIDGFVQRWCVNRPFSVRRVSQTQAQETIVGDQDRQSWKLHYQSTPPTEWLLIRRSPSHNYSLDLQVDFTIPTHASAIRLPTWHLPSWFTLQSPMVRSTIQLTVVNPLVSPSSSLAVQTNRAHGTRLVTSSRSIRRHLDRLTRPKYCHLSISNEVVRHLIVREWSLDQDGSRANVDTWIVYFHPFYRGGRARRSSRTVGSPRRRQQARSTTVGAKPRGRHRRRARNLAREAWITRPAEPQTTVEEDLLHDGFCDPSGGEPITSVRFQQARQSLIDRLTILLPERDRKGIANWTDDQICQVWNQTRWRITPEATRNCTRLAPSGQFRIGVVQGQQTASCWKPDRLFKRVAPGEMDRLRLSTQDLNTLDRYQFALSQPSHLPCYQRRDVPAACREDCIYQDPSERPGWWRTLGQIVRLIRKSTLPEGDCVPSAEMVHRIMQRCREEAQQTNKPWTTDETEETQRLVLDLIARTAQHQIYLPIRNDPRSLPEEIREARHTLDAYQDRIRLCVVAWSRSQLCLILERLVPSVTFPSTSAAASISASASSTQDLLAGGGNWRDRLRALSTTISTFLGRDFIPSAIQWIDQAGKLVQSFVYEVSPAQIRLLIEALFPNHAAQIQEEWIDLIALIVWIANLMLLAHLPVVATLLTLIWRTLGPFLVDVVASIKTENQMAGRRTPAVADLLLLFVQSALAVLLVRHASASITQLLQQWNFASISDWPSVLQSVLVRLREWMIRVGVPPNIVSKLVSGAQQNVAPGLANFLSELSQVKLAQANVVLQTIGITTPSSSTSFTPSKTTPLPTCLVRLLF